jgi:peptidoglycan/LPS O-acetylase OafA/YrhL
MHSIDPKNNFDHIRLFLALSVFFFHTAELTQLSSFLFFKNFISASVAVHSFFIVSGFLIFMSYERSSSIKSYFEKRFKRIAPGYVTVVVLAFLLLSLLSLFPLSEYFTSSESWKYLLANLLTLGFLHPTLPGVFTENYITAVNGALWTIKVEIMFYLTVPLIVYAYRWFGRTKVLIAIFILSTLYFYLMGYLSNYYHNPFFIILQRQLPGQMMFFSAGALVYYHQQTFLKYKHFILIIAVIGYITQKYYPFYPLYALSLSIIVIYLATAIIYLGHISKYGDLSYGIYIWHFPIIQTFIALALFDTNPWLTFIFLTVTVLFISWLSWHFIEKPFLNKKSHYIKENK